MISKRICIFVLIFGLWLWAGSIFTPWATSTDPRLWLYDALFYTRFVLLFWGAFELLHAWFQIRNPSGRRRSAIANIFIVCVIALIALANAYLLHTGNGFRARVDMSATQLQALQQAKFADIRQRAGWFLIDTQRQPCGEEAWLWLGQAHGGGTGTNLALVYSESAVPKTSMAEAFRFWPVSQGWWLAYQNPVLYQSHDNAASACRTGITVQTHVLGMQFIRDASSEDVRKYE
jgi:hypothetical protein